MVAVVEHDQPDWEAQVRLIWEARNACCEVRGYKLGVQGAVSGYDLVYVLEDESWSPSRTGGRHGKGKALPRVDASGSHPLVSPARSGPPSKFLDGQC